MSASLPSDPSSARSLTDVMPEMIASLDAASEVLPTVRSAVVVVVDGLGAANLAARAGHARFLSAFATKRDVARTVFPSTTAAALASLLTGVDPGTHGIVGYRVRVPDTGKVVNQLKGWDRGDLDPRTWQRAEPLLEAEARRGRPVFVVSKTEFATSGLTEAILRGAEQRPADGLDERADVAADLASRHPGALVYLYAPELDHLGHGSGWESDAWAGGLDRVDAAVRRLVERSASDVGVLLTADHGMIDVPSHRHVLFGQGDGLADGIADVGGEPRMLHLYAADGRAAEVLERWRVAEESRSWVLSRGEAIAAGLFGEVDPAVVPRIGDVLVAARAGIAYYDARLSDTKPQQMVGQHGSLTPQERIVPFIRLGAYAR